MASEYLTIPEVAGLLRLGERTTYELARLGKLAGAAKVGAQWRVKRSVLEAWLARGGEAALALPAASSVRTRRAKA